MTVSDEQAAINAVTDILRQHLDEDYPSGTKMLRDAHPKMHGCVQAELFVHHQVPTDLRHGVFARPGVLFNAWVRFSNAFMVKPDLKADTRGMAVKLLDVAGDRLPPPGPAVAPADSAATHDAPQSGSRVGSQDFLAATYDAFFIPDPITYVDFPAATRGGPLAIAWFFIRRRLGRGFHNLKQSIMTLAMNPLAVAYFSQTAYALGATSATIVKFKFEPIVTDGLGESLPNAVWFKVRTSVATIVMTLTEILTVPQVGEWLARCFGPPDLLRRAMARSLCRSDAWFDVKVQRRVGAMSVEDATDRWDEGQSPFQSVAYLRIPRQVFFSGLVPDSSWETAALEMEQVGENLSFNPWNGLAAHKPLGGINRARRVVYPSGSQHRHDANQQPVWEPTAGHFDALKARTRLAPSSEDPRPMPGPAIRRSRWWKHYFRRVPLLTALVMLLLPLASIVGPLAPFTHGVFDVRGPALFGAAVLTALLSFTVLVEWWVITAYGDRRFRTVRSFYVYPIKPRWYLLSLLLALPTAWATWRADLPVLPLDRQDWAFQWLAGMTVALLIAWSVRWTADFLGGLPPVRWLARMFLRSKDFGAGYVDFERQRFLPGQLLALGLVVVTVGITVMLGALTLGEAIPRFGALQFAVLLLILVSSFMAAATYFFDRFNVPVLASLVVLALVAQGCPKTAYRFELLTATRAAARLTPAAVLAARAARSPRSDRVIVVTASGGGAQAAAWTTAVLGELTRRCRTEACTFDEAVAMVSGTSGGAVGAMQFVAGFERGGLQTPLDDLHKRSADSSQSALWRALLFHDSVRMLKLLWNRHPYEDRGRALEQTWERGILRTATLRDWREDSRVGQRPGLIFNTTIQETGAPLLLSTAGELTPPSPRPASFPWHDFFTEYPCRLSAGRHECFDLPVVRAARLSAAVPVVTPRARDGLNLRTFHPVDGGYADVWGVDAGVEWLRQAINDGGSPVKKVLILEIRTPQIAKGAWGIGRADDQAERDRRGVKLLVHELGALHVQVEHQAMTLSGPPAIAWHLTASERADLDRQVLHEVYGEPGWRVVNFLKN